MDRFTLEEQMLKMWSTDVDIEQIYKYVSDVEELDRDTIANLLLGLYNMHRLRSQEAFDTFETLIQDGVIR